MFDIKDLTWVTGGYVSQNKNLIGGIYNFY